MATKKEKISKNKISMPLPVIIMKEKKWFLASCPPLNIGTQGKTEQEVKENIDDLIDEYLQDPDTSKPKIMMETISLTFIQKNFPQGASYGQAQTTKTIKGH